MPQTSYAQNIPAAVAGMLADASALEECLSRLCEPTGGIDAGMFVIQGTDKELQCVLPGALADITGKKVLGVTVFDASKMPPQPSLYGDNSNGYLYSKGDAVPVLHRGRIWVFLDPTQTPAAGDSVYVQTSVGSANTVAGYARTDADTVAMVDHAALLPGAVFRSAAKSINLHWKSPDAVQQLIALVELNLPITSAT